MPPWRIVADENVGQPVLERLRADGHEVEAIAELAPSDDDYAVLAHAVTTDTPLLTEDLDFGRYVFGEKRTPPHAGIVQYRLSHLPPDRRTDIIAKFFRQHGPADLAGFFVTIDDEDSYRFKPLP